MIDINEPLELEDGTPVRYAEHALGDIKVTDQRGDDEWYDMRTGRILCGVLEAPKLRNVAAPASGKTEDQEFWERAYLAALSNSVPPFAPETIADDALRYRNKRWPS